MVTTYPVTRWKIGGVTISRVIASIHCFVIQSEGRTIVVDTCVGNDKPREVKSWHLRKGRFLEDLAEAGFPRERYLFGAKEWEYFSREPEGPDRAARNDSVRPILDANLADLVAMDHRITAEVFLEPTPGHTPGHVSVRITSKGEEAVITGDLMHHPVQCAEPGWAGNFDVDPEAARRTRRAFFERYAGYPILVLGTHFATPTGGRIVRDGETFRFAV